MKRLINFIVSHSKLYNVIKILGYLILIAILCGIIYIFGCWTDYYFNDQYFINSEESINHLFIFMLGIGFSIAVFCFMFVMFLTLLALYNSTEYTFKIYSEIFDKKINKDEF